MKELGYYDGNFCPLSEMQIPMCDRASWFGDGVYDAGPRGTALSSHSMNMWIAFSGARPCSTSRCRSRKTS